jgi:hypothetical protein
VKPWQEGEIYKLRVENCGAVFVSRGSLPIRGR